MKAYWEYTDIRDFIQRKKYDLKDNLHLIKNLKYENTKKLENLIYNKFKPNRNNFYEKNTEFSLKMKSFLSNLKETAP